jgi:hypothetical protein
MWLPLNLLLIDASRILPAEAGSHPLYMSLPRRSAKREGGGNSIAARAATPQMKEMNTGPTQ